MEFKKNIYCILSVKKLAVCNISIKCFHENYYDIHFDVFWAHFYTTNQFSIMIC